MTCNVLWGLLALAPRWPYASRMPKRNSPRDVQDLADLSRLSEVIVDKRVGKRALAKVNRRNRHYEKQFVRNAVARAAAGSLSGEAAAPEQPALAALAVAIEPEPQLQDPVALSHALLESARRVTRAV